MDIKASLQFHNETYPNWNLSTFRDDVTVENSPSQQTLTQANPHVRALLSLLYILLNSTTPAGALGLCTVGNLAALP